MDINGYQLDTSGDQWRPTWQPSGDQNKTGWILNGDHSSVDQEKKIIY